MIAIMNDPALMEAELLKMCVVYSEVLARCLGAGLAVWLLATLMLIALACGTAARDCRGGRLTL
jgi:hypothetical protein